MPSVAWLHKLGPMRIFAPSDIHSPPIGCLFVSELSQPGYHSKEPKGRAEGTVQSNFEHQEVSRDYPEPLETTGVLGELGRRALPALSLSIAAVAAYLVVCLVLLIDHRWRTIFVLPFHPGLLAWPAAFLALVILLKTRLRPGRPVPRYIVLLLTTLGFLLALTSTFIRPTPSPLQILIVAQLAAVLALSPRLVRLRPESPWIQRIAILSLAGVLFLILPTAILLGNRLEDLQRTRVAAKIDELNHLTDELRRSTRDFDWNRFQNDPRKASANIEGLAAMHFREVGPSDEIMHIAGVFGLEEELNSAANSLIDTVAEALEPGRLPRTSALSEPAIHWDSAERRWIESTVFPVMSDLVGRYHSEIGRLFIELEPATSESSRPGQNLVLAKIRGHYQNADKVLHDYLQIELTSFADHWAVQRNARFAAPAPHLVELLKMPLFKADGRFLPLADLRALLGLPFRRARELAGSSPGCFQREYTENSTAYFRTDCYAYAPAESHAGAEMRIEFRLVYSAAEYSHEYQLAEAYLILPIPSGISVSTFRLEVLDSLAKAAGEIGGGSVQSRDRSGSVASGFRYRRGDTSVNVVPLEDTSFTGRQQALHVRLVPLRG